MQYLRMSLVLVVWLNVHSSYAIINLLTTLIRDNVVGNPLIHQKQQWPFHPDHGVQRNPGFEALHGHRSYNLIEKLGLGTDGRQEERKYQQMIRDLGVPTTSYDPTPPANYQQQLQLTAVY